MQGNTDIALIRLKLEIVKNKLISKKRFSKSEKEYFKKSIVLLALEISEVVKDDNLAQVYANKMDVSSRKQMVHIKKALSELEELLVVIEELSS